jgi:gas vesicle protein
MNEEYTDDQIEEWTREDLLNAPLLSDEEIQELRKNKQELTAYAQQKLRKLKMNNTAQKCVAAARNVTEGNPTLGELIRNGRDPIQAKVFYEYGAVLRTLVEELGYDNYHVDGDHGIGVVNVKDILALADELEAL